MTPESARALYARQIRDTVTLRRIADGSGAEVTVRARVSGTSSDELVGGIEQRDLKVILLAADLTTPPQANDEIVLPGGRVISILAPVDDQTRRVGGELIAYEMTARG